MSSIQDFREAIDQMISYLYIHERKDFIEQLESCIMGEDVYPANHIFLQAFAASNALREADGEQPETLAEFLDYPPFPGPFFICEDVHCAWIGTRVDPIQDRLILSLEPDERIPAGVCLHCAGMMRAI